MTGRDKLKLLSSFVYYKEGRLYWVGSDTAADSCVNNMGYRVVRKSITGHGRVVVLAHRLTYWMHDPSLTDDDLIDHVNLCRTDNELSNLRKATRSQNMQNRRASGVRFNKSTGKWYAIIGINNSRVHLGFHPDEATARAAYLAAKRDMHPYASEHVLN